MANLADDDLLLVQRTSAGISTNYSITGSALKEDLGGPDGLITPPVAVLTPLNGAGLNDGQSYTPMSSAYVSTDSTPIYHRYFSELITTVSGGSWTDENEMFDGNNQHHATLNGAAGVVSQAVFTNLPSLSATGETQTWAYASGGGTIEVIDENDVVLRTYPMATAPQYPDRTDIGIVRVNNKIRYTTTNTNDNLYIAKITLGVGAGETVVSPVDSVISGRVAFEFTDDTDLDKMVAPIIQTDENGNVKVPTTSTVDSTTTITGENKSFYENWNGDGSTKIFTSNSNFDQNSNPPVGPRMTWVKATNNWPGIISDNVSLYGKCLETDRNSAANNVGPLLDENQSQYPNDVRWNDNGVNNFVSEIGVAPKVLDIVNFTGNGATLHAVPHNLGCKPGMIIIKGTTGTTHWVVWHKDLTSKYNLDLDGTYSEYNGGYFPSEPTQDAFYVSSGAAINSNAQSYVAYVFAADTTGKVKCGTYTGTSSQQDISCGFNPGFVLIKRIDGPTTNWVLSTAKTASYAQYWGVNSTSLFGHSGMMVAMRNTGFRLIGSDTDFNQSGGTYAYLAINYHLSGPNSTQLNLLSGQDLEYFTTGTQITSNAAASGSNISFGSVYQVGDDQLQKAVNPVVDGQYFFDSQISTGNKWLIWAKCTTADNSHRLYDSERNTKRHLYTNMGNGEFYDTQGILDEYTSYYGYYVGDSLDLNNGGDNYIYWNFLAAPQFFDVQKYAGNGVADHTIQHDLGVEPGFIIIKNLRDSKPWICYHHELGFTQGLSLNSSSGAVSVDSRFTGATSSDFTLGTSSYANNNGDDYISYIFAKDTPYMKCGSYTGAGSSTQVNVGFQPRWMLIKSSTSDSQWIILDKQRPNKYLKANSSNPEGNFNYSFTSTGVTLSSAWGSLTNNGDTYVYVAIADESEGHPPSAPSTSTVTATPDPNTATMVVNAESFDVGATASAPALEASITSVAGSDGNKLLVDGTTGTWLPGLYAKGSETTINAPGPDEITFTSTNAGTTPFSGLDATLSTRTWTLESGPSATGPWTLVDSYVDYDVLNSQDGATPWSSNKPNLTPNTFYRVKVEYNSTNAESVESVYNTFKTGDA